MRTKLHLQKFNYLLFFAFFLLVIAEAFSPVPFSPRLDGNSITLQGDITFAANSIMNRRGADGNETVPYNGTSNNNDFIRNYINVDPDGVNFSSSSADLIIPPCSRIEWAGLYWSGAYEREVYDNTGGYSTAGLPNNDNGRNNVRTVRFRVPGGGYVNLTADAAADPAGEEDDVIYVSPSGAQDRPYTCFKEVT